MARGSERFAVGLLAAATLVLRGLAFFRYRFDSDEPQHLHVAWGWTAGMVQYRDYFDNHAPLFHMLTAPILALFGERADILLRMRAPMLLLWLIVSAATFVLARRFGARAAWAVVLLNAMPPFFLKSLEYRTDNLWMAFWMLALVVLVTPNLSPWRAALGGLLLGAALATSMKTLLLVVTLAAAALFTWRRANLAAVAAFPIVPAIVAAYFVHLDAWKNLVYCVITFNELVKVPHLGLRATVYAIAVGGAAIAWRRTAWVSFAVFVYTATVVCFWNLITPRDFLPILPVVAILASRLPRPALIATATIMLASLYYYAERFENRTREHITMMNQVLHLTRPGEPLMDLKGETIYRRRPYYYVFEAITREAIDRALIADTIPEDIVRARCYVVQANGPFFPKRGGEFMDRHFVDVGRLRAAGAWVGGYDEFEIAVPGPYVVLGEGGEVRGLLDGTPYTGARELQAGEHHFMPEKKERLAVLWAPAYARGFSPFHHRDKDF
ncbi:MAG TPA: hypothetical protein VJ276_09675 [Thermoanaerobaculia bacterium]|nr:hypothetical protein [Thermoanaerobaculia bacterium]